MKKILIFICLMFAFIGIQAQESSTYDQKIAYDNTWGTYGPSVVPYSTTLTDSTWYFTFLKESYRPLTYKVLLRLDSVGGTAKRTTVILQTKDLASEIYTDLSTKYWVLGSDTTITFTNLVTPIFSGTFAADSTMSFTSNQIPLTYRYWRVLVRNDTKGFITKVPEFSIQFKEQ